MAPWRLLAYRIRLSIDAAIMSTIVIYITAALAEIAGCFSFWAWLRSGHSALWVGPGAGCLILFATLLTLSSADMAGRAYAAYGGIYILTSLFWMWAVEGHLPDVWDAAGAALCLAGAAVFLWAPHAN